MTIFVSVNCDSAAFVDNGTVEELARIFDHLAAKARNEQVGGPILDCNGNNCGEVRVFSDA